jgi:hypothetical protein
VTAHAVGTRTISAMKVCTLNMGKLQVQTPAPLLIWAGSVEILHSKQ